MPTIQQSYDLGSWVAIVVGVGSQIDVVISEAPAEAGGENVNIPSMRGAGASESATETAYAAIEGAVVYMTRDLARRYAPKGMHVTAVSPASLPSGIKRYALDEPATQSVPKRRTPLGGAGPPVELKGAAVCLASNALSSVTGEIPNVDGGRTPR